jgi:anti-sigma B factor antagonist
MMPAPETHDMATGEVVIVRVTGDVDLAESPKIREQLAAAVSNAALGLVVDLSAVRYLDSAGVRLLFQLRRRLEQNRQQLRLVVPESGLVRRVLAFASLETHLRIYPTAEAALADFHN